MADQSLSREIVVRYIQENYSARGENSRKELLTSADIVSDLSQMVYVDIATISDLMQTAGFNIEFLEGKPYWVVYQK